MKMINKSICYQHSVGLDFTLLQVAHFLSSLFHPHLLNLLCSVDTVSGASPPVSQDPLLQVRLLLLQTLLQHELEVLVIVVPGFSVVIFIIFVRNSDNDDRNMDHLILHIIIIIMIVMGRGWSRGVGSDRDLDQLRGH